MIRSSTLLLAVALLAWTPPALAQEAAARSPEAEAPEPLTSAPDGGPAPERYGCDPALRSGPYACPREVQRRWHAHQQILQRLEQAVAAEGPEFSERKLHLYVGRVAVGATLIAGGAVCLVYALVHGISSMFDSVSDLGPRGAGVGTFVGGIVGLGVGVPLLMSGVRGKKRQQVLRRAEEIRAPFDPFEITATLHVDPRTGSAALALCAEF